MSKVKLETLAAIKTIGIKPPIANHPLFGDRWDKYANSFNNLAKLLEKNGIDIGLMREVIEAAKDVERLSFMEVFKMGFHHGMQAVSKDFEKMPAEVEIALPLYN